MVGDRESDIQTGLAARIRAAAVCTGKHDATAWAGLAPAGVPVFPSLVEFVTALESEPGLAHA
jgi:ribonucleotide monophosphatase NagD (HAD superfamily)